MLCDFHQQDKKRRGQVIRVEPGTIISQRVVMGAILKTLGPVCIFRSLGQNWKSLRSVTPQEFLDAAIALQNIGMGTLIHQDHQTAVFIKRAPAEIEAVLHAGNGDLCDKETYSYRFSQSPNKCITWNLRAKLVSSGYVSDRLFM